MAGKIPQPFIDQVLDQTDIVDLIDGYIELKPKGKEYSACCPFHHEKTPSFTVSAEKQFYHCFGCGAHGTAVSFLMEHEGLEFIESIELLAQRLGLDVPREQGARPTTDSNDKLYKALEFANGFYQQQLRKHTPAKDYLKGRQLSGQIAAHFALGYAPAGFDNLRSATQEFDDKTLIKVGLLSSKDSGRSYDRFRERIMFPIRDRRGRVIAFGGRVLDQSLPKYINSPETPLFHKNQTLYGLYEARKAVGRLHNVLIVEGYMDVVALAQHGIQNAVATLGTATTGEHIRTLLRYTAEIIFCFDGDRAGRDAAWKALQQVLPEFKDGVDIRFMFMPEGEDPDSLVHKIGQQAFLEKQKEAMPLSDFLFSKLAELAGPQHTPAAKAKLAALAKPLLNKIPPGVFRKLMMQELNTRVGTTITSASEESGPAERVRKNTHAQSSRHTRYSKTRLAIALVLRNPGLAEQALPVEELQDLTHQPGMEILIEMLQILEQEPHLTTPVLIERFQGRETHSHLTRLLQWEPPDMGNPERSFADTMRTLARDIANHKYGQMAEQAVQNDSELDEDINPG